MGVRGDSSAKGTMYGYTWFAGMVVMSIIAIRVSPMLPEAEAGLLWAGVSMLVVGVLYMAGGAIFLFWPMFFVGVGVSAVNGLGVLLGPGWHALLTAVLPAAGRSSWACGGDGGSAGDGRRRRSGTRSGDPRAGPATRRGRAQHDWARATRSPSRRSRTCSA